MNIFHLIWHYIGLGITTVLITAHLITPAIINQPIQVASSTVATSTSKTTNIDSTIHSATPTQSAPPPTPLSVQVHKEKSTSVVTPTPLPQQQTTVISPQITSWTDLENKYFVDATQKGWASQTLTNEVGEKHYYRLEAGTWVRKDTLAEAQQLYQSAPPPNTTLCNGTYWTACPAGRNFVCPGDGGQAHCQLPQQVSSQPATTQPSSDTLSPPPAVIVTPQPPAGHSPAQQTAQCQQQYSQSLPSLNAMLQGATDNYNHVVAQTDQIINNCGASGTCFSGARGLAQQQLDQAKAQLDSATAQYQTSLATFKNTLQTCLSSIPQS